MICPFCGHDNISGDDVCAECGQSLIGVAETDSLLVESISNHAVSVLNPARPLVVEPTVALRDAVQHMAGASIGCLLVVESGSLIGIITERDVLNKISDDASNLDVDVREFMTPDPITIRSQDSIAYALHAMVLGGYRHMPIVDENSTPAGIISVRDILRFLCIRFADTRGGD